MDDVGALGKQVSLVVSSICEGEPSIRFPMGLGVDELHGQLKLLVTEEEDEIYLRQGV